MRQQPPTSDPTAQDIATQDPTDPTAQDIATQDPTDPTARGVLEQNATTPGAVGQDQVGTAVGQESDDSSLTSRYDADFSGNFSITVFAALFICYTVQALLAGIRAMTKESIKTLDGEQRQVTLWQLVWIYDGGTANVWTFFILAIFSPVFLTGLGNILPFVELSDHPDRLSAALYSICLAAIGVIITLELSYVHNLRTSAKDWIPMLVVAIALDIITLVVFFSFVTNPHEWDVVLGSGTRTTMTLATLAAVLSSFMILMFARCAGALTMGQVQLPVDDAPDDDEPDPGGTGDEERETPKNASAGLGVQ